MTTLAKNLVVLGTLLFLIAGTGVTLLGIFKGTQTKDKNLGDDYIIPSQVFNSLTVMFLLYLTASNTTFSASYKLIIILLLVGGLVLEIYLTNYSDRDPESIAAYVFIAINFLIRTFFLIDLSQSEWTRPFAQPIVPIKQAITEMVAPSPAPAPAPAPFPAPVKNSSEQTVNKLKDKWNKLRNMLKDKPEGLDIESESDAWKTVIRPGIVSNRTDVNDTLKDAVSKLKDKSGNPIPLSSVDTIGGRKRA